MSVLRTVLEVGVGLHNTVWYDLDCGHRVSGERTVEQLQKWGAPLFAKCPECPAPAEPLPFRQRKKSPPRP